MSLLSRFVCSTLVTCGLLVPSLAHAQPTSSLEIPGNGTTVSGVGMISGWKCEAGHITIRLNDGDPIPATYGLSRADTSGVCGNAGNNGFFSYTNWGRLGDGTHTAVAYDNGTEFARSTFTVTTLGMEFLTGASARVSVPDFPHADETTTFEWNQATQHLEAVMVREGVGPEDLNDLLEPMRQKYKLPALAGGIVHAGELIGLGAVGVRRVGSPERVTVQDRWRLLSCGKSMTATLIALLVEAGDLSWQTTIGEAFPALLGTIDAAWQAVTVEQLLAHRSGLSDPSVNALIDLESPPVGTMMEQRLQIVELVLQRAPAFPPGSRFEYANAGYTIAGAVAEAATGKVWEELMAEQLFVPLRMASADFGAPGHPETNSQPRAHTAGRVPIEPGGPDDLLQRWSLAGPAGLVHSSIEDWGKFVAMQLAGARGESHFLKSETFQKLHTPAADEPAVTQGVDLPQGVGGNYALGWVVMERSWADGRVLSHPGYYPDYAHTFMAVVPNKDFAVLLATNIDKWGSLKEAAWTLIQHFLGE